MEASGLFADGKQMGCASEQSRSLYGGSTFSYSCVVFPGYPELSKGVDLEFLGTDRGMSHIAFQEQFRLSWERTRKERG